MHKVDLSVVVPVYNGAGCFDELLTELKKNLDIIGCTYEMIFVEDNGADQSWSCIERASHSDLRVKGIQLARNYGEPYAISAGVDNALGDRIAVVACDMQDDPRVLPTMFAKLNEGYDLVSALRTSLQHDWKKLLFSNLFYGVVNALSDKPIDRRASNYVMMSKLAADYYRQHRERSRTFRGIVAKMNLREAMVEVPHLPRAEGKSNYNFSRAVKVASVHILSYSDKPFEYILFGGFFVSFVSFVYGTYTVINVWYHGADVAGWSSLIVSIFFLGGTTIAIIGFMGLYIKKCFDEVMQRPLYFVRNRLNIDQAG